MKHFSVGCESFDLFQNRHNYLAVNNLAAKRAASTSPLFWFDSPPEAAILAV